MNKDEGKTMPDASTAVGMSWFKQILNRPDIKARIAEDDRLRKQKQNECAKKRRQRPEVRASGAVRRRLHAYLMGNKKFKRGDIKNIIGCSWETFEKKPQRYWPSDGSMGWHNYGEGHGRRWEIDHLVPVSYYGHIWKTGDQMLIEKYDKLVNHYTNLFPLWNDQNRSKSNSLPNWIIDNEKRIWSEWHEIVYGVSFEVDASLAIPDCIIQLRENFVLNLLLSTRP